MTSKKLVVSISPHIHSGISTSQIMWLVFIVLMVPTIFGITIFGYWSLLIILVSIICAVLTEFVIQKIKKVKVRISDGSAALTGLLLALTLPPKAPLYVPAVGAIFAIAVVKHLFGGLGHNIFNPALIGRAFLQICWPKGMSTFITPIEGLTCATPLTNLKLKMWKEQEYHRVYFSSPQTVQALPIRR